MKKILLIISTLLFAGYSHGKEITGEMNCKVKSNHVISIDEGVSEVYSGFEKSFSKGDNLVFSFTGSKYNTRGVFELKYKDDLLLHNSHLESAKVELGDDGFSISEWPVIYSFKSDWIYIEGLTGSTKLYLKRYYKSDWNGFFTKSHLLSMTEQVVTLDCRQSSDKVDDFIQHIRRFAKK